MGLLAVPCLSLRSLPERDAAEAFFHTRTRLRSLDPCEAALRAGREARTAAVIAANQEQEKVEEWDPIAAAQLNPVEWREALMAADASGYLRRARAAANRAADLARSPAQAARVAAFQMLLEHEAGHHTAALQYARRMIALCPQQRDARRILRMADGCMARAARCRSPLGGRLSRPALRPRGAAAGAPYPPVRCCRPAGGHEAVSAGARQ